MDGFELSWLMSFFCRLSNGAGYNTGCEMAALTVARKEEKERDQRCSAAASESAALISRPAARVLASLC